MMKREVFRISGKKDLVAIIEPMLLESMEVLIRPVTVDGDEYEVDYILLQDNETFVRTPIEKGEIDNNVQH